MKQLTARAIVLRRTNYQEADRILSVITDSMGKISIIAKGVRRQKSKLAGGIELFAVNDLSFIKGKSDLHTLTSSRIYSHFNNISSDLNSTMKAYEFLKIIDKTVEDQVDANDYFEILTEGLAALNINSMPLEIASIWFYLHALQISGLSPELEQDSNGDKLKQTGLYIFDPSDMQFKLHDNGNITGDHLKLLRIAARVESAQKLSAINIESDVYQTCYQLCKGMAEHNLL